MPIGTTSTLRRCTQIHSLLFTFRPRLNSHFAPARSAHGIDTTPPDESVTMLNRARKAFEDSAPPPKHESKKTPFLSSSPPARHDGNIAQSFKNANNTHFHRNHQNHPSRPSQPSQQQQQFSRPPAFLPPNPRSNSSTPSGFTSTSSRTSAGSATTAPSTLNDVVDLTNNGPSKPPPPGVFLDANDFSDDDDLDLDFELPVPPPPASAPTPDIPPPPTTASSQIPWSSSPAAHFEASNKLKRASPMAPEDSSPIPVAKRRTLPRGYKKPEPAPTPAPKRQDNLLLNATESAMKERKRLHKSQAQKKQEPKPAADTRDTGNTQDTGEETPRSSKTKSGKPLPIALSSEQSHILDLVVNKEQSVFFTGPAGTGKSVLMRAIIQALKKKWVRDPEKLSVTASTGLAACNIGGITLHSFSGIGLGKEDAPALIKKIRRNMKAKQRWTRTRVLIIDEISMVDGELFDKLSQIGRTLRNNGRPWGGIQLVITGDFFQLPPVPDGFGRDKKEVKFSFESITWPTSIDHTIGLTEVFRQKDPEFAGMLNEMRLGKITPDTLQAFKKMSRPLKFDDGLEMTELFSTRGEVENSNSRRLKALHGGSHVYDSADSGQVDKQIRERLLSNMMAPKRLELKKGAQVMLIKNIDDTLVNGSIGTVIDFKTEREINAMGSGDHSDGDGADDWNVTATTKKRIQAFNNELDDSSGSGADSTKYPIVKFNTTDGNSRELFVMPDDWKIELPNGEIQASRKQVPLILAWALSIHKAQGQTLERVKVDLGRVFEKGQAYVALSRATSQHGLQVLGFQAHKVMAHNKVISFYDQLYSVDQAMAKKTGTLKDFGVVMGAGGGSSKPAAPRNAPAPTARAATAPRAGPAARSFMSVNAKKTVAQPGGYIDEDRIASMSRQTPKSTFQYVDEDGIGADEEMIMRGF